MTTDVSNLPNIAQVKQHRNSCETHHTSNHNETAELEGTGKNHKRIHLEFKEISLINTLKTSTNTNQINTEFQILFIPNKVLDTDWHAADYR